MRKPKVNAAGIDSEDSGVEVTSLPLSSLPLEIVMGIFLSLLWSERTRGERYVLGSGEREGRSSDQGKELKPD